MFMDPEGSRGQSKHDLFYFFECLFTVTNSCVLLPVSCLPLYVSLPWQLEEVYMGMMKQCFVVSSMLILWKFINAQDQAEYQRAVASAEVINTPLSQYLTISTNIVSSFRLVCN